jgi:5-methylcytosine-specific restriction endonuclease McrA
MGRANKVYKRNIRLELLQKNPRCSYCNKKVDITNSNLDHVVPKAHGGNSDRENLVLSCIDCNCCKASLSKEEWDKILPLLLKDKYFYMPKREKRLWRRKHPGFLLG